MSLIHSGVVCTCSYVPGTADGVLADVSTVGLGIFCVVIHFAADMLPMTCCHSNDSSH